MPGPRSWTQEQDNVLRECFAARMSCAEAATKINKQFGTSYSRNSVIGRASRKGIETAGIPNRSHKPARDPAAWRSSGVSKRTYQRRKAQDNAMAAEPDLRVFRCTEVDPLHIDLLDLTENACRWPYGDGPFTFCGCEAFDGGPYCEPHATLALNPRQYGTALQVRRAA